MSWITSLKCKPVPVHLAFPFGIAAGTALGVAMDNVAVGIAMGVAIGATWRAQALKGE